MLIRRFVVFLLLTSVAAAAFSQGLRPVSDTPLYDSTGKLLGSLFNGGTAGVRFLTDDGRSAVIRLAQESIDGKLAMTWVTGAISFAETDCVGTAYAQAHYWAGIQGTSVSYRNELYLTSAEASEVIDILSYISVDGTCVNAPPEWIPVSGMYPLEYYTHLDDHFTLPLIVGGPPVPAVATFGDVPTTHPFFKFVEAIKLSGLTSGCGGGDFCPNTPITRGQMAVFLSAVLGIQFQPVE